QLVRPTARDASRSCLALRHRGFANLHGRRLTLGPTIRHAHISFDLLPADVVPAVASFHRGPTALAKPATQLLIVEDGENGVGEALRVVPDQAVVSVDRREALASDR